MTELLSLKDRSYGPSGLYNTLYQANLRIERITLVDDHATIQLAGQLNLRGECDDPRVGAQLKLTALQFPTVKDVAISINGRPLDDVLSLR
jgi:Sporulation and spore germination